jgi:hypothetical protein
MKYAYLVPLMAANALLGCAHQGTWDVARPYGALTVATTVPPTDMYRVVLQQVDGKVPPGAGARGVPPNVSLMRVNQNFYLIDARSDFTLPAGEHRLSLTAIVDRQLSPVFSAPRSRLADNAAGELKLTVEEGKRYYIAAKVNEIEPERWQAVVYKVEDIPNYAKPGP